MLAVYRNRKQPRESDLRHKSNLQPSASNAGDKGDVQSYVSAKNKKVDFEPSANSGDRSDVQSLASYGDDWEVNADSRISSV